MIRENMDGLTSQTEPEIITDDPGVQYNMGQSEKFPVHIPTFLQQNEGDLAIKVNVFSSSSDHAHLHPRYRTFLRS